MDLLNVRIFIDLNEKVMRERRMRVNKCSEEYFEEKILVGARKYRKRCEEIEGVFHVDGEMKIKEVLEACLKHIQETRNKSI